MQGSPGGPNTYEYPRIQIHNNGKMETLLPQSTKKGMEKKNKRIHQWKAGVEKYFRDRESGPGGGGGGGGGGGRGGI